MKLTKQRTRNHLLNNAVFLVSANKIPPTVSLYQQHFFVCTGDKL